MIRTRFPDFGGAAASTDAYGVSNTVRRVSAVVLGLLAVSVGVTGVRAASASVAARFWTDGPEVARFVIVVVIFGALTTGLLIAAWKLWQRVQGESR